MQIVDSPNFPLDKSETKWYMGLLMGAFVSFCASLLYFLVVNKPAKTILYKVLLRGRIFLSKMPAHYFLKTEAGGHPQLLIYQLDIFLVIQR